jgi:hypothetical protein
LNLGTGLRTSSRGRSEIGVPEAIVVTVGGVDTYYNYEEQCWKYRRLGGGPIHEQPTRSRIELPEPKPKHRPKKSQAKSASVAAH